MIPYLPAFSLTIRFNGKEVAHDCGSVRDVWYELDSHFNKVIGVLMTVISLRKNGILVAEICISKDQWYQCFHNVYDFDELFFNREPRIEVPSACFINRTQPEIGNSYLEEFKLSLSFRKYWGGYYLTNTENNKTMAEPNENNT